MDKKTEVKKVLSPLAQKEADLRAQIKKIREQRKVEIEEARKKKSGAKDQKKKDKLRFETITQTIIREVLKSEPNKLRVAQHLVRVLKKDEKAKK